MIRCGSWYTSGRVMLCAVTGSGSVIGEVVVGGSGGASAGSPGSTGWVLWILQLGPRVPKLGPRVSKRSLAARGPNG